MELYNPGTETITAAASYWHSTYSPKGEGQVLLVYLDAANASVLGQPSAVIYTDNAPLARYVADTFNQHFDDWKTFGFKDALPTFISILSPALFCKRSPIRIIVLSGLVVLGPVMIPRKPLLRCCGTIYAVRTSAPFLI